MYLAIPVVFIYLLFLANHKSWALVAHSRAWRWITRGALAGLLFAAIQAVGLRSAALPAEISREVNATGSVVCPAIPVAQFYATAREVQKIAEKEHADLVLVGGGDRMKHLAYALRPVIGIDAIYGPWERRAWRMIEESTAHHEAILFINHSMPPGATAAGGGKTVTADEHGNAVADLPPLPRSARFRAAPASAPPPGAFLDDNRPPPAAATALVPPPVLLPKNVDLAKVAFTSLNGSKNYLPGKDFSVEQTDAAQLLRRTPASAIAEGETILLSWKGITTYSIPTIYVLKTHGKNAYDVGVPGLASVFTPQPSKSTPHPVPQVVGNGR